jgi:hypothetical protein
LFDFDIDHQFLIDVTRKRKIKDHKKPKYWKNRQGMKIDLWSIYRDGRKFGSTPDLSYLTLGSFTLLKKKF